MRSTRPPPSSPPLAEVLFRRLWFGTDPLARLGAALLAPLSFLTAQVSRRRRQRIAELPRPHPPVVVIGNLVVGGAGKTPLTIAVAQALAAQGHRVGLLCSGYRGQRRDARLVSSDADAIEHGDEAVLLAHAGCGPVAAGRHRGEALSLLLHQHPDRTVIVSDDGLQHAHLPRTVGIAVFDRRGIGNGRLLPAGPLRESLAALEAIEAIALNEPAQAPVAHRNVFRFRIAPRQFVPLDRHRPALDAAGFARLASGHRLTAIAGIGEPQRFFDTLTSLGLAPTTLALADHAPISRTFLDSLPADLILMTAKDAVKCRAFADQRCWVLEVSAELDPRMVHWLNEVLVGHSPA